MSKTRKMTSVEEAQDLEKRIHGALRELGTGCTIYAESEVRFRHSGLRCLLIMALHDVKQMIEEWEEADRR